MQGYQKVTQPLVISLRSCPDENWDLLFCINYRKLNIATKKGCFPLARIDDILGSLAGAKWNSTRDLKSGYWQVALHPDNKDKTAFLTDQGL
jgi:hypothetical protein